MLKKRRRRRVHGLMVMLQDQMVFGFVLLVLALVLLRLFVPILTKKHTLREKEQQLLSQIHTSQAHIRDLEEKVARLANDKEYIEKIAREKLGLGRDDEVVYTIVKQ